MKKEQQLRTPLYNASEDNPFVSKESRQYLQELQGECRIKSYSLLRISYIRILCIATPFALTIIGLLLLYHYKKIRVCLSFSKTKYGQQDFPKVTHVYVQSQSGIDAICPVYQVHTTSKKYDIFRFEELNYELKESEYIPLGINVKEEIQLQLKLKREQLEGLGEVEIKERQLVFGKNEHFVKIPPYYNFLFNALTSLNLGILYLNALITFIEYSPLYCILLLTLSFITININYLLTRKFYRKIKTIAEKDYSVRAIRMGREVEIKKSQLLPGDIYRIDTEIPCDSILLRGGAIVNESGLTGENIPIKKFAIEQSKNAFQQQHWVYEGSPLISHRQDTYAVAISTAFTTRKGKIIRRILHKNSDTSQFFRSILPFIGEVIVVHILLFAIFFHYMFKDIDNSTIIYLRFGEFLISGIPSFLQIEENLYKSIYLVRLNKNGIFGTDVQKTIESSRVETICFDKTGTLTLNQVVIQSVLVAEPTGTFSTLSPQQVCCDINVLRIFASCHNVQAINNKLSGDQIDLAMFSATGATVSQGKQGEVFAVQKQELRLKIIRVNQFQSRFQSMSVLLVDQNTREMFVFAKGAPEKLYALSTIKNLSFQPLIKQLCLKGLRTIAFSMRKINTQQQFSKLLEADRQQCLKLTSLVGLVTFSNGLKNDAVETIASLSAAEIKTKIVTGDNLFVAIHTALTLGIVPHGQRIIALEGARLKDDEIMSVIALKHENGKIIQEQIIISPEGKEIERQNLAMDQQYILCEKTTFLNNNVVVFARTTPETKAFILRKEKEYIQQSYLARSWKSRTFGDRRRKVMMVGDGANDLMALRQAHIGIGISESDAVYCSNFTVATLSKIPLLIIQSRAGQQRLLELTHFYYIYRFLDMVCKILQTQDFAIYPPNVGIIRNFLTEVALCVVLAFGVSSNRLNKYIPSFNMLSLHNQLTYWGSSLIVSAGITTCYYYFRSTSSFVPNPDHSQLGYNCQTATITMIFNIVLSVFINISIVQSKPWKQRIWTNIPSMFLLTANIIFITVVISNLSSFGALGLLDLQESDTLVCFFIVAGFGCVCFAFNTWIQSLQLYKK